MTGLEVLAGYYNYYLFQGCVVVSSHSAFIILRSKVLGKYILSLLLEFHFI